MLDDDEENIFSGISGDVVFFGGGMQVITSAIVPLPSRICLVIGWFSSFLFCGGGGGGGGGVANDASLRDDLISAEAEDWDRAYIAHLECRHHYRKQE